MLTTSTTSSILRQKSQRPRQKVTNNLGQKCQSCQKSADSTTFFTTRQSLRCHKCTPFCMICHCGEGGICVQNHANVLWPSPLVPPPVVADQHQPLQAAAAHTVCHTCAIDPPCTRTKSCRCTKKEGTKSCPLHYMKVNKTVTMTGSGTCNNCAEDRRNKSTTDRSNTKVERNTRLKRLKLPTTKATKSIVPSKDAELRRAWNQLYSFLSSLVGHMNATPPIEFNLSSTYAQKNFYFKLGVDLGLGGNHYGYTGAILAKKMVMWFTRQTQFGPGVTLRPLPLPVTL